MRRSPRRQTCAVCLQPSVAHTSDGVPFHAHLRGMRHKRAQTKARNTVHEPAPPPRSLEPGDGV